MSSSSIRRLQGPETRLTDLMPANCTVLLGDAELHLPANVFSLDGFRQWVQSDDSPADARLTYIDDQVIIDMSGEEIQTHGLVRTAICGTLYPLITAVDLGLFFLGGALITNRTAGVSNIPDAGLATWASLQASRVRLVATGARRVRYQELEGTPDWVLEIVSDSSVDKDTRRLRAAYHRAGIPEYWLINARGKELVFQILLHQPRGYEPAPKRGGWQVSPLFGQRFRLEREAGRMGFWNYTLQVKPLRAAP